jgi:hypothetical protein
MLPLYAEQVMAARASGKKPADVVFVSLGKLGVRRAYPNNWCVVVGGRFPVGVFDFTWARGLDIEVVADSSSDERTLAVCQSVNAQGPRNLVLWEATSGRRWWLRDPVGAMPRTLWQLERDRSLMLEEYA